MTCTMLYKVRSSSHQFAQTGRLYPCTKLLAFISSTIHIHEPSTQTPTMILTTLPILGLAFSLATAQTTNPAVQNSLDAIDTIHSSVQTLITELRAYNGGLVPLVPLALQVTKVDLNTKAAAHANEQLPNPLTHADTQTLVHRINNTLAVVNPRAVSILETKKKYTEPLGVDPLIVAFLQMLLDDHLRFSNAILERVHARDVAETNVPMVSLGVLLFCCFVAGKIRMGAVIVVLCTDSL